MIASFRYFFSEAVTSFRIARQKIASVKEFQEHIDTKWESFLIVVDSVMCTRTYGEISELYNNIQDFLVEKTIRDLYELTNRSTYSKGKYHYESKGVFEAHIKKFLGERAGKEKNYFEKLLYRPLSADYDNLE